MENDKEPGETTRPTIIYTVHEFIDIYRNILSVLYNISCSIINQPNMTNDPDTVKKIAERTINSYSINLFFGKSSGPL